MAGPARAIVGILVGAGYEFPFQVGVGIDDTIGGPSAGLMFALGIVEKLGESSLTGGKHIAGTGEITADGTVGAIGGIPQKLVAARDKGVDLFLVPEGNCAEAMLRPPAGLALAEVATLDDALAALEALRAGEQPEPCPA